MKKIISYSCYLLSLFLIIFVLVSCKTPENISWELEEADISSAIELDISYSKNNKDINITLNDNNLFNDNISKSYVKIIKFNSESSEKLLSTENLDDNAIDFSYEKNDNNINLKISNYDSTLYTILVNKGAMKDNCYGAYLLNTIVEEEMEPNYIGLEEYNTYSLEENPTLVVDYIGYEIDSTKKISLSGALASLEVKDVIVSANQIEIQTEGVVKEEETGSIIFTEGFFKDCSDIVINVENKIVDAYIEGVDLSDNYFVINVKLLNQKITSEFGTSTNDVILSGTNLGIRNILIVDNTKFSIVVDSEYDYKTTNELLDGAHINIEGRKLSYYKDVILEYRSIKPSLSIRKVLTDNNNLSLYVKAINASISSISATIESKNKTASVEYLDYDVLLEFNELLLNSKETIEGVVTSEVKDIFGNIDTLEVPFDITYPQNTLSETSPEKFNEQVIEADVSTGEAFRNATMFIIYAAQIGISFSTYGNPCAAISSVISMLNFVGFSKGLIPSSPSIQDVLNKLDEMDRKLDEISDKLDRLSETVKEEAAATQMGIDKALYVIYKNSWENFYYGSINELDSIIRNYGNAYRTYLVNLFINLNPTDTLDLKICYCMEKDSDGNYKKVICAPKNDNYSYSTSGAIIIDVKDVSISASDLSNIILEVNKNGYTSSFDEILQADLAKLSIDGVSNEDIYNAIITYAQKEVITVELSNQITNAYCNFARGVYYNGNSQLSNFFGMVESLYCFEQEAKLSIDSMRANLKNQLIVYGSFVSLFAEFSGNQIDDNEVTSLIDDACKFIKGYAGSSTSSNYCYVTKTNVKSAMVNIQYGATFFNPGPGCEFFSSFNAYEWLDESTMGFFNYFNNQSLLDQTALLKLKARFEILATMVEDYSGLTFEKYLIKLGILRDWQDFYSKKVQANKGTALPSSITVITSFDGLYPTGDNGNTYLCTKNGWGDYFREGSLYQYKGSRDEEYWSGMEARGILFIFNGMTKYGNILGRYARYDEGHWWWNIDEHHSFTMYSSGTFTLAFYKC